MNNKIEVLYNGKYPNTCSGDLIIKIDEKIVYKARHQTTSTGSCYFTNNYSDEHVESGELLWSNDHEWQDIPDDKNLRELITYRVNKKLSEFDVCCGGCL